MAITDVNCGLMRLVEENRPMLGDHAGPVLRELKHMDEFVFSSIEVMDDLFKLVREDLASRKEREVDGVLPVNALDAYLEGVATLPPTPKVNRSVQTEGGEAAIVTPSPKTTHDKPARPSSVALFDLLRARNSRHGDAPPQKSPKLEIKSEGAASGAATKGKKRFRSAVSSDDQDNLDRDGNKRGYYRTLQKTIHDRRPIAVHDTRVRSSQREYAVEFEGLEEHVWLATRRAPAAAKVLIREYIKSHQRGRRKSELQETVAAYSNKATAAAARDDEEDGDSDELDNDGIYIVEKIVDHRIRYGKKQYFVKWDGYDTDDNTWEPAAKLRTEVRDVVDDYERDLAKAAGRKAAGEKHGKRAGSDVAQSAKPSRGRPSSSSTIKSKPAAWGRPSNPSALTKSTHMTTGPSLLQRSGKIPKVQFLLRDPVSDDDESDDSDLMRLATSTDDDASNVSSGDDGVIAGRPLSGKGLPAIGAAQRPRKEVSPQID
jgi:hypothetical protein